MSTIRFRSLAPWLAVLVLCAGAAAPAGAAFDADSALVKAHRLTPAVVENHPDRLWPEFDAKMREALHDSASFATTLNTIHAQTGALDSVLTEQVTTPQAGLFVYRAKCRFAGTPQPLELILAFDADGRVGGLLVRPSKDEPRKEYP